MRRRIWTAVAVLVVAGLIAETVLWAIANPHRSATARFAFEGAFATMSLAVAVLGLWRYRHSHDWHSLFLGSASLVLGAQSGVFGLIVPFAKRNPWGGFALPAVAWAAGWLIGSVLIFLAIPIRDRRGRAPVRMWVVVGGAIASLGVADLVLYLLRHELGSLSDGGLLSAGAFGATPAPVWVLAIAAAIILLGAAVREIRAPVPTRWSAHRWTAAVGLSAAAAQIVALGHPVAYRPLVNGADVFALGAAAFAYIALAARERDDALRARRASDAARAIAEVAGMVAHEVRGPVSTIKGLAMTSLAHSDRLSDGERRRFVQDIASEADRLASLTDRVSTALRADVGSLTYDRRTVELSALVKEVVSRADIGQHPVRVEADEDVNVDADPVRMSEALRELVENAARFSPADSEIVVRLARDDSTAVVEIEDRGPGLPDRAFERFARVRPAGFESVPGAGLGLSIARSHARAHGGEVSASTAGGPEGTIVRVTLPLAKGG